MKHLQLFRNSVLFNTRQEALDKWADSAFTANLQDGEFIAARYKDDDDKIYVMTGHFVASIGKIVEHDFARLAKDLASQANSISVNTENINSNATEISNLKEKIDAIDGIISGDVTELVEKINTVSGDVNTFREEVTESITSLNDSCGFENLKYVQGPDYISGATSVTDALNILSTSLKNKVSYDALKHSITIDGNEQVLNVGQLLTDMSYDASTNILTLYYKDENDGSGNTAVNIDMTQLVTDAVNTAVINAELTFTKDDTHNVTFTKTGNTVMADVDTYDCGEY